MPRTTFQFRPWVQRAGVSVVGVAVVLTALVAIARFAAGGRGGWESEPAVWAYLGLVWLGGLRIFLGARWPIVEMDENGIVIRPLHTIRFRRLRWDDVVGTERMVPGDRLIIYHSSGKGMRFVALNLNLIRGRRKFEILIDDVLKGKGFVERLVERSRYLSRPGDRGPDAMTSEEAGS